MSYLADGEMTVADGETGRVAKGATNPFETSFKPLIDEMNNSKGELERRCAVASRECKLENSHRR